MPIGEVISNGKIIAGRSSPQTFYVAQFVDKNGEVEDGFGFGNLPSNATAAFGGGMPLIVNGMKYGSTNLYGEGASGAPLTGDPRKFGNLLVQRSNNGYAAYEAKYERGADYSTGKVIVAYSVNSDVLAFVVQPNDAKLGMSIGAIRDRLYSAGFNNAVAFDGSSSATLVRNGAVQVQPAYYKNAVMNVGIGARSGKH